MTKQTEPRSGSGRSAPGKAVAGWRRQLGELALACAGSFPSEEAQRLRDMHRLLAKAPTSAVLRGAVVPDAERLEQLIAAEASSAAALSLLGSQCGYLLSRGAGGQHLASVVLPGAVEEISASGDTLTLALVGALALALADTDLREPECGAAGREAPGRSARLN